MTAEEGPVVHGRSLRNYYMGDPHNLSKEELAGLLLNQKVLLTGGSYTRASNFNFKAWSKDQLLEHIDGSKPLTPVDKRLLDAGHQDLTAENLGMRPIPHAMTFEGKEFIISAATHHGVPYNDAEYNIKYLKGLGFETRLVSAGEAGHEEFYVYGRKR